MIKLTVGQKIKQLRKERKLTQEELGKLLGVKKAAVQKYESGVVQNLKQSTIKKLCEIFDKTPDYFILEEFDRNLEIELKKELEFVQIVKSKYGEDVFRIFETVIELKEHNQKKVLNYVDDVAFIQRTKEEV